jgi:hypothetical protein
MVEGILVFLAAFVVGFASTSLAMVLYMTRKPK